MYASHGCMALLLMMVVMCLSTPCAQGKILLNHAAKFVSSLLGLLCITLKYLLIAQEGIKKHKDNLINTCSGGVKSR